MPRIFKNQAPSGKPSLFKTWTPFFPVNLVVSILLFVPIILWRAFKGTVDWFYADWKEMSVEERLALLDEQTKAQNQRRSQALEWERREAEWRATQPPSAGQVFGAVGYVMDPATGNRKPGP